MRLQTPRRPLLLQEHELPCLQEHEVLLRVLACGVCRTDLHLADGELSNARYPVTPGHEVVGRVVSKGSAVVEVLAGDRVGVPWLGSTCGVCRYCQSGSENLCDQAKFTGCTLDGGYAQFAIADARYCLSIPERYADAEAAPLLCAGVIGYRALRLVGESRRPSASTASERPLISLAQMARRQWTVDVFAFVRPGDEAAKRFAYEFWK